MKKNKIIILVLIILSLTQCTNEPKQIQIEFTNDSKIDKVNEIVEVEINQISKLEILFLSHLEIIDNITNNEIVYQIVNSNQDEKVDKIIFQTSIKVGESKTFTFRDGGSEKDFSNLSKTYAKFVPERMDDFAWENDRIAFRMYGPALEATGEISNGIDVWSKNTRNLILDSWYKGEDYHTDHGEGVDYYKVGPSLGAGGSALWENKKLNKSKNFTEWKIISNGPIRTNFQLTYATRNYQEKSVAEIKNITLDAGKNLNKIEVKYSVDGDSTNYQNVIGIVKHPGEDKGATYSKREKGIFGYWEPTNKLHGNTAVGVIVDPKIIDEFMETETHYLIILKKTSNDSFTYYSGAGWSKSGDFKNFSEWTNYLEKFSQNLMNPIK